jgi:hypothetical protein
MVTKQAYFILATQEIINEHELTTRVIINENHMAEFIIEHDLAIHIPRNTLITTKIVELSVI